MEPNIPEDELRKIVLAHMLKYGNDFAESLQDENTSSDIDQEVEAIMDACRQYAAKERLDENRHAQTIFNGMRVVRGDLFARCFWQLIQRGKDLDERIKQLKEGI